MKKSLIALALIASGSAVATESNISASGVLMSGMYMDVNGDIKNNGATGADLFVDYSNGNWKAQYGVEIDIEDHNRDHSLEESNFNTIDTWIGYQFGPGLLSAGLRGDSALDSVDAFYDMTVEFGNSPSDASDVGSFLKFENQQGKLVYGVSAYTDRNLYSSDVTGMNGYIGFRGSNLGMNVGFEVNENTNYFDGVKEIFLINGLYMVGKAGIGATYSLETGIGGGDRTSYGITAGTNLTEKFYFGTGYHFSEFSRDTVNLGGKYFFTPRLTGLADVAYHLSDEAGSAYDGEFEMFVRLDYTL